MNNNISFSNVKRTTGILLFCVSYSVVASNSVCFSTPYDPSTCLSWTTDSKNITFTANWPPIPSSPASGGVGWGAWGISSLSCGSMFPASVSMAIRGPNGVVLEDRATVGHVVPLCRKEQLSYVTESRINPDGSFTISWTRPLIAPRSSGQPSILPGNVTLIGAVFFGSIDLRPCEPTGIPAHQSIVTFTVELIPKDEEDTSRSIADADATVPLAPAPAVGLIATLPVCTSYTNFAQITPSGSETFYGASSLTYLLPGINAVDPIGRRLYSFIMSNDGLTYELISIDVDSGIRGSTCSTTIPVPSSYSLQNLNMAWDGKNKTVIVAGCTDTECAGYVQVSRIDPKTCELIPIVKVPTDPPISYTQGGSSFDPSTSTFLMTVSQAIGKKSSGPVLISVDMIAGKVTHSYVETGSNITIYSLTNAGPGLFKGVNVFPDLRIALATVDSIRNKITLSPIVPNCVQALPGLSALEKRKTGGDIFYFITLDGTIGAPRIIGLFATNGTIASIGNLPGDASLLPSSLFIL